MKLWISTRLFVRILVLCTTMSVAVTDLMAGLNSGAYDYWSGAGSIHQLMTDDATEGWRSATIDIETQQYIKVDLGATKNVGAVLALINT